MWQDPILSPDLETHMERNDAILSSIILGFDKGDKDSLYFVIGIFKLNHFWFGIILRMQKTICQEKWLKESEKNSLSVFEIVSQVLILRIWAILGWILTRYYWLHPAAFQ